MLKATNEKARPMARMMSSTIRPMSKEELEYVAGGRFPTPTATGSTNGPTEGGPADADAGGARLDF